MGKGRRRGTRILVGSNVDEGDFSGFVRFACPIKGRANFVRILHELAMASEALSHLIKARIAEVSARLLFLRIGRPAAVKADHDSDRQIVTHRRIELHRVKTERAVTVHDDNLFVRLRGFRPDTEGLLADPVPQP